MKVTLNHQRIIAKALSTRKTPEFKWSQERNRTVGIVFSWGKAYLFWRLLGEVLSALTTASLHGSWVFFFTPLSLYQEWGMQPSPLNSIPLKVTCSWRKRISIPKCNHKKGGTYWMGESILYIRVIYITVYIHTHTHTHTYITGLYIWINIQNIQRTHTI